MKLFTRHDAPRLRPLEIAASFVSRLAAWLRYTSAARFCFDFDLNFEAISAGDAEQLRRVADLTNTPVEDLGHGPIREGRQFRIEGHLLSTAYLDRIDIWLCPDCAQEDMETAPHLSAEAAVAVRRDDVVSAIATCSTHQRRMVKVGRDARKHGRHDTSLTTMDVSMRMEELRALSQAAMPSLIDTFVRERFSGKAQGYELLDPMSLNQVIKLSGRFGQWLEQGEVSMRRLDRVALNRLYSTGLEVLAGGRATIAQAIEKRYVDEHGSRQRTVMNDIWMLLDESRNDPAVENLREVVSQAAKDYRASLPFRRRRRRVDLGDLISIDQAKERYRTGPKAVEAFARAANALMTQDGSDCIHAARLHEWMQREGGIIPAWQVATNIGATAYQMDLLISSGILTPVVPRTGAKKSYDWFRPKQVEILMDRMVAALPVVDMVPDEMLTLTEMLARTRGALSRVNQALFDGTMPAVRLTGEKPYAAILVRMDDVMELMGQDPTADAEFLTLAEFAAECGFNSSTACTLAVLGVFESEMRISAQSGMLRRMVPKAEVERFRAKYVSAARLAAEVGESRVTITARMAGMGVDQVDTGKARITLFEREKVAHMMSG